MESSMDSKDPFGAMKLEGREENAVIDLMDDDSDDNNDTNDHWFRYLPQEQQDSIGTVLSILNWHESQREIVYMHLQHHHFDLEQTVHYLLEQQQQQQKQQLRSRKQEIMKLESSFTPFTDEDDDGNQKKPSPRRSLFQKEVEESSHSSPSGVHEDDHRRPRPFKRALFQNGDDEQKKKRRQSIHDEILQRSETEASQTNYTELSHQWHDCYQAVVDSGSTIFIDPDFPPVAVSLDGRRRVNSTNSPSNKTKPATLCHCGVPAAPKQVQSDGPNYGKFYLACGQQNQKRRPKVMVVKSPEKEEKTTNDTSGLFIRNPYLKKKNQQLTTTTVVTSTTTSAPKSTSPPQRRKCNFFQWDPAGSVGALIQATDDGYSTNRYNQLMWTQFGVKDSCTLYKQHLHVSQICQGAVGNCWFLSALAVVAEQPYLMQQILPQKESNNHGVYQVNFCLDGKWQPVVVDANLPVLLVDMMAKTRKKSIQWTDGVPFQEIPGVDQKRSPAKRKLISSSTNLLAIPAFCATPQRQIWPALVEKAYAKVHGSYAQLSGGFIAEALQDLTGAPVETFIFSRYQTADDINSFWQQLKNYHKAGFLMGVATSQGGEGLVGGHAYSILDVIEVQDAIVGEQAKVTDFFKNSSSSTALDDATPSAKRGERTTVRLVRIRNPWGKREWKGAWGADSERWTKALRKRLPGIGKADGTFYMSFTDMLQRFHHMDICKTQQGWFHTSCDGRFRRGSDPLNSSEFYELIVSKPTRTFVTLIQPKKRSNTKSKYWYSDCSFVVLKKSKFDIESDWTCEACLLSGIKRDNHCELVLDPSFVYCCVPFGCIAMDRGNTDSHFPFRLTTYSDSHVVIQNMTTNNGSQEQQHTTKSIQSSFLEVFLKELLSYEHKLIYRVAHKGVLFCIHGEGCLYFLAVNGASDHYLSLKLNFDVSRYKNDGMLVVDLDQSGDTTYDIAPRKQKLLAVVTRNGKQTNSTYLNFTYMSSVVPVKTRAPAKTSTIDGAKLRLGSNQSVSLAADLISSAEGDQMIQMRGGDTIDTYLWIPQLGSTVS